MRKPMPISKKSVSTVARQILRKVRRIRRLSVRLAAENGILELIDSSEDSKKVEARVVKVCRRQRRKLMPLVLEARV